MRILGVVPEESNRILHMKKLKIETKKENVWQNCYSGSDVVAHGLANERKITDINSLERFKDDTLEWWNVSFKFST